MKYRKIEAEPGNRAEEQYIIEDIEDSDVSPVTHNFHNYLKELDGFSFVNYLTSSEIVTQARKQFVSYKPK